MNNGQFNNKLALVIATKDRQEGLCRSLTNISGQSYQPDQVVVVDGGDRTAEAEVARFPGLGIEYIRVRPPGLTKQKNAGVAVVRPEIGLVGFIDDDIMMEGDCLELMMAFWEDSQEGLGGTCFNITNTSPPDPAIRSLPKRLFFLNGREAGTVHRSGCITPIWDVKQTTFTHWLGGGYTVWNKEVFDTFEFDEWFPLNALLEDVHFSYQVGKKYKLAVISEARAEHVEPALQRQGQVWHGKRQMFNWVHFVMNNPDLSLSMCLWACTGRMLSNLVKGMARREFVWILRAFGNSQGLAIIALQLLNPARRGRAL